jgi:hypothetical protein
VIRIAAAGSDARLDIGVKAFPSAGLPTTPKITFAVSAASWRPASEAPAYTITGQPCTGRAMLSGTRNAIRDGQARGA